MAKKVVTVIKLAINAGKANPAPPIGPALGSAGIEKGSGESNRKQVASITRDQLRDIAQTKIPDLNANDIEAAMRIVEGTARNMGVAVAE